MIVALRLFPLLPVMAIVFLSGCSSEAFVESRAFQHKSGRVNICRTSDQQETGYALAEKVCQENWFSAPKLVNSQPYRCAMTAPNRDIYQCGGALPVETESDRDEFSLEGGASITKQVLSVDLRQYEEDRPLFFRREDEDSGERE